MHKWEHSIMSKYINSQRERIINQLNKTEGGQGSSEKVMRNPVGPLHANDNGHSIFSHAQHFHVCVCVEGMEAELVLYYTKHQTSFK